MDRSSSLVNTSLRVHVSCITRPSEESSTDTFCAIRKAVRGFRAGRVSVSIALVRFRSMYQGEASGYGREVEGGMCGLFDYACNGSEYLVSRLSTGCSLGGSSVKPKLMNSSHTFLKRVSNLPILRTTFPWLATLVATRHTCTARSATSPGPSSPRALLTVLCKYRDRRLTSITVSRQLSGGQIPCKSKAMVNTRRTPPARAATSPSALTPDAKRLRTIILAFPVLVATSWVLYKRCGYSSFRTGTERAE